MHCLALDRNSLLTLTVISLLAACSAAESKSLVDDPPAAEGDDDDAEADDDDAAASSSSSSGKAKESPKPAPESADTTPASTAPATSPATGAAACCTTNGKSKGTCMPEALMPPEAKGQMPKDSCEEGNSCMPANMIKGEAVSCEARFPFGKGICMDKCFNDKLGTFGGIGLLSQEGCDETEFCTPCALLEKNMPEGMKVPGCE
jgi:hypothetical protein